jgi:serine/threonine-protein kinase HipA
MTQLPTSDQLRFSLAGVQLKFSAVENGENRFTLPFRGMGGRWILKFGSEKYPRLPENEHATMTWAAAVGLNIPEQRLVPARSIEGLDPRFYELGEHVYVIERYDRLRDGRRVHQEDLAQVRGIPPDGKYFGWSLEGIARLVGDLCGNADLDEYLRRMMFLILSGNTDAHLKNWSLIYPDGRSARLSPAYDFVCVRQYLPTNQLALPLAKERIPERIDWEHVARAEKFLRKLGHSTDFEKQGREFVRRCLDAWQTMRGQVHSEYRDVVDAYLARLPLVQHVG